MGRDEVEASLTPLARERRLAATSHRQALWARPLLYAQVPGRPLTRRRLPVVRSCGEVVAVPARVAGVHQPQARLPYCPGLRIAETLQLRVKGADVALRAIVVREGTGGKDRVVMLPGLPVGALRAQWAHARRSWPRGDASGRAGVRTPDALGRKYPRAGAAGTWFRGFQQAQWPADPGSDAVRRHHLHRGSFRCAFKRAVPCAGVATPATAHAPRHGFATRSCIPARSSGRCRDCSTTPTWPRR
jgi:integrase